MYLETFHVPGASLNLWQNWALIALHSPLAREERLPLDLVFSLFPCPEIKDGKRGFLGQKAQGP